MSQHFYGESYHGEPTVDIAPHLKTLTDLSKRCAFVLEIGCGAGNGSTRAFQSGLSESPLHRLHVSVDADLYQPRYERPDVPWWWKVTGDSREFPTAARVRALVGPRQADIIFIDTDHTYEVMQEELEVWQQFAHNGTIWLFHDTWMGGKYNHMTDAIKEFAQEYGWVYSDLSTESHGLGQMRKL